MANKKIKATQSEEQFNESLTNEQILEVLKCKDEPLYFINKYCKIVSVDAGIVDFKTYEYQDEFVNLIHNNRFVSAMMARQLGKSITVAAYITWYIIFNHEKIVALVANKAMISRETLNRIQQIYLRLPKFLQRPTQVWNKGRIILANGSGCIAGATTASAIRGFAISMLVIDEVAFIDRTKWDEFYDSTYATISSGKESKIIFISTPNGLNHFYEIHMNAKASADKGYRWMEVPWHLHPNRDEAWKSGILAGMTGDKARKFAQEFDIKFFGSSRTLIDADYLSNFLAGTPIKTDSRFNIFEQPAKNEVYFISGDSSEGIGEDAQAFSVLKLNNTDGVFSGEQVASFSDPNLPPDMYAHVLATYGTAYNEAYILGERASTGEEVLSTLWDDLEYENIVQTKNGKLGYTLGLKPTVKTKRIGCVELKNMIEAGTLKVNCARTIEELKRFTRVKESYEADKGYHDDLVMGLVNFAYYSKTDEFKDNILSYSKKKTNKFIPEFMMPDTGVTFADEVIEKPAYDNGRFVTGRLDDLDESEFLEFIN